MSTLTSRGALRNRNIAPSSTPCSIASHMPNAPQSLPERLSMKAQVDQSVAWDEFELIEKVFAPLARNLPGAFGLKDDVAALPPRAGHELVLKTDSTIES